MIRCSLVLLSLLLCGPAWAIEVELTYTAPSAVAAEIGPVTLHWVDAREQERGGGEPRRVGTARAMIGIPYALLAVPGMEPSVVVPALVADGFRAGGVSVAPSAGTPVRVTLQSLWADGYAGRYQMTLTLAVEVLGVDGRPVYSTSVQGSGGVTVQWSERELDKGFRRMLEDALEAVEVLSHDPEFRKALGGSGQQERGPTPLVATRAADAGSGPPSVSASASAAAVSDIPWTDLEKRRDQRIFVDKTNGTWVVGLLMGAEEGALVLQKGDGRLCTIGKKDVRVVRTAP